MSVNRCDCGSTQIIAEAVLVSRNQVYPDGTTQVEWYGDELVSVICSDCGAPVKLDPAMTIALMHHLIEKRERGEGTCVE